MKRERPVRYFFTGDWHLQHKNILFLASRPFASIDEHDMKLQANINGLLTPKDHLVILGDLCLGRVDYLSNWLDGLVTKNLFYVQGNHDHRCAERLIKQQPKRFLKVEDILRLEIPHPNEKDQIVDITCCHYAMRVWNKSHHGAYHVFGHSHGSLPDDPHSRSMDCGVDTHDYKPWALEDIIAELDKRDWKAVDHHRDISECPGDTLCGWCHLQKRYHHSKTFHCPTSATTFHMTKYFVPIRSPKVSIHVQD